MTTIRLSSSQQQKVIDDFQSEDEDRKQDAIAVFCEHDLTILDIVTMGAIAEDLR